MTFSAKVDATKLSFSCKLDWKPLKPFKDIVLMKIL